MGKEGLARSEYSDTGVFNNGEREHEEEWLRKYGLDERTLKELRDQDDEHTAYLARLFKVASYTVETKDMNEQEVDRDAIHRAKELLKEYVIETKEGVSDLVGMLRMREAAGVRDVQVLEEVFDDIHREFIDLANDPDITPEEEDRGKRITEVLNQFAYFAHQTLMTGYVHRDENYLAERYFRNFCIKQKFTESATLDNEELPVAEDLVGLERLADFDRDTLIPFEFEEGRLALFGTDRNVLYVADKEYSEKTKNTLKALRSQITYAVRGQYFARRIVADIPEDLEWATFNFADASGQLGRDEHQSLFADKEMLRDFLYLHRADMRETIEDDFGVELYRIPLRERIFFLRYLQNVTVDKVEHVQHFTHRFGVEGARSFLALNEDESFGDIIIQLGETLDQETAKTLFKTYAEIIDASEAAAHEIEQILTKSGHTTIDEGVLPGIAKQIRSRANNLLRNADKKKTESGQLLAELEDVHASSILQSELFRGLVRNGELSPEHLDMLPTKEKGADIPQENRRDMLKFFERNYRDESREFKDEITGSFQKALDNPNTDFYVLRDKRGNIVAFSRIDHNENELYFGSFNVHNMNTQGSGIGSYMLKETLREAKERADKERKPIHAHCDPTSFITQKYIEWGFVATKLVEVAGKPSFEIEYTPGAKRDTKELSLTELEAHVSDSVPNNALWFVFKTPAGSQPDWSPLARGYVLTRFFSNSESEIFTVFERPSVSQVPPKAA